jgi:hypothetical protein
MEINLKTKNALNSFSLSSLATLTYYLPFRAETLHNVKTQLLFQKDTPHHTEKTVPYVKLEEKNVIEYFSQLKQSSLFITDDRKMLHHIYSDIYATEEHTDSLLNYRR